jgi:hypothetical protein
MTAEIEALLPKNVLEKSKVSNRSLQHNAVSWRLFHHTRNCRLPTTKPNPSQAKRLWFPELAQNRNKQSG